jgi:hypothetical protein
MGLLDSNAPTWLPLDDHSGARITIDYPHHEIHAGKHYTVSYPKVINSGSVSSIVITTPASSVGVVHLIGLSESSLAGSWVLGEGASTSVGSALTAYNNNRISANTSGTVIVGSPSVTTVGTTLESHVVGADSGPSRTGGTAENRGEWILAGSTSYILQYTSAAASNSTNLMFSFYVE